jgi:hypothetical protein
MIAAPVNHRSEFMKLSEMSREQVRDLRIRLGLELPYEELTARRRRLCQKPAPVYAKGFTFTAQGISQGQWVTRECKVIGHQYEFSRQFGQTLRYVLEGGGLVLAEQIQRAMNPSLARTRYLDYCQNCDE